MQKKILLSIIAGILTLPLRANIASPIRKTLPLAGGETVEATLRGDEFFHCYLTDDGTAFLEQQDGTFRMLSEFEVENLKEEGRNQRERVNRHHTKRKNAIGVFDEPIVGKKKGLVILVDFYDQHFSMSNPQETYQDFFNKENYTELGMSGSVSDYFRRQSYGKFEINFDVVGPVTLEKSYAYYGQNSDKSKDINTIDFVIEACKGADAQVNFSDYDADNDGKCDFLFFVYAGYGEAYGASTNTIWPHHNDITNEGLTLDNAQITEYACSCELCGKSGTKITGIGVACHEFSHCLGLPDFYDINYKYYGMSYWDLMDTGDHTNDCYTPIGYTSYEKWMLGWLTPTEITSITEIKDMKPLSEEPEAYILYNEGNKNEFYMLENRQQIGTDAGALGHGLLVLHVNFDKRKWMDNAVNTSEIQGMSYVAADGEYKETALSLAGDPFQGTKEVTNLTEMTDVPATVNNANKDGSYFLHKNIEHITESDEGLISFLALRPWLTAPQISEPTDLPK